MRLANNALRLHRIDIRAGDRAAAAGAVRAEVGRGVGEVLRR